MKNSPGFTLIELLVVATLLAIIGLSSTQLFFSLLKGGGKASLLGEVKQEGNYALLVMERMVKNAKAVSSCSSGVLTIVNPDKNSTTFSCVEEEGVKKIASNSGRLTTPKVTLGENPCPATLSFACTSTLPPVVTIKFTLKQKGTPERPEEKAQSDFQTTISLRTY